MPNKPTDKITAQQSKNPLAGPVSNVKKRGISTEIPLFCEHVSAIRYCGGLCNASAPFNDLRAAATCWVVTGGA